MPAATLKDWAQQLGGWEKLVNKSSTTWRNLLPQRKNPGSDPEWTLLLKEYPALIRRPVVVQPDGSGQRRLHRQRLQEAVCALSRCAARSPHHSRFRQARHVRRARPHRDLIRRRSVTPEDAGCLPLIGERLAQAGFRVEHLRYGEVDNLWATHGRRRAGAGPTLVFLGHTDVVPSGPEARGRVRRSSRPFAMACLYGRGAADMKGSVAAMVVALEQFVAAHPGSSPDGSACC